MITILPTLDRELVSAVSGVFKALLQNGYGKIRNVPLRKYPQPSEHLSVYEKRYAPNDLPAFFSVSVDPTVICERILDSEILRKMYLSFFLNAPTPTKDFIEMLGEGLFNLLVAKELVQELENGRGFRSLLRYVPDEGKTFVTSAFDRDIPCFTYLSYDSIAFAKFVKTSWPPGEVPCKILDYCCGTGYVGLRIKRDADSLLGVDLNPNAIWMAELNSMLSDTKNCSFICAGNPPEDGLFDLIVCNPPFVMLPPDQSGKLDSYGGGDFGLELTLKFIPLLYDRLSTSGEAYMITKSPVIAGEDYLLKTLTERFPDMDGIYRNLSPSLAEPDVWEKSMGIESFNHIILSFKRAGNNSRAGWGMLSSIGQDRYCYAF